MTPPPQPEYIITEERLVKLQAAFHKQNMKDFFDIINEVFNTPRQSSRDTVLWSEEADLTILKEALDENPNHDLGDVWCDVPIRTRFEAKMMDFAGKMVRVTIVELRQQAGEP
jgi:uncharacterized protein HemY